jgi:acetoin utilization deacetylase AcuC-like enzyme
MPSGLVDREAWASRAFAPHHPLTPRRLRLAGELFRACHLLAGDGVDGVPANAAGLDDLRQVHTPDELDAVRTIGQGRLLADLAHDGLGPGDTPALPEALRFSVVIVGPSRRAAALVEAGGASVALSAAGGRHPAMPSAASRVGALDPIVVAVDAPVAQGCRVADVDLDVHTR